MPFVTITHRRENSGTNRLNSAAGKIILMQSGSSAFLKKVMFGSSHSKVSFANAYRSGWPLRLTAIESGKVETKRAKIAAGSSGGVGELTLE